LHTPSSREGEEVTGGEGGAHWGRGRLSLFFKGEEVPFDFSTEGRGERVFFFCTEEKKRREA